MQIDFKLFVQEKRVLFQASMCSLGEFDDKNKSYQNFKSLKF
jgi:hypothetical protein